MRNLILFILLSIPSVVFSQNNAYQLSKALIKIEKELSNGTIQPGDKRVEQALGLVVWYADKQDADSVERANFFATKLLNYPQLNSCFKSIREKFLDSVKLDNFSLAEFEFFLKVHDKNLQRDTRANEIRSKIRELLQKKASVNAEVQQINKNISQRLNEIERINLRVLQIKADTAKILVAITERKDELRTTGSPDNNDTTLNALTQRLNLLVENLRDLSRLWKEMNDELPAIKRQLIPKNDERSKLNLELRKVLQLNGDLAIVGMLNQYLSNLKFEALAKEAIDDKIDQSPIAGTIALDKKQVVEEESNERALFARFPSEAAMIDALAIYLAKRVKQESVMWFFETIKRNASTYDLIQTFFPNTITLLQSNEVYEIPNLGSQWRYALSKDFVTMPKNVFKSEWFKRWFPRNTTSRKILFSYLEAGFDIADLMIQRYDYKGLVKQMYLQLNKVKGDIEIESKNLMPKDFFALLYAFNQECFEYEEISKDSLKTRLLGFEDFLSMSKNEIEIMLSLIDLKYGGCISKFFDKGILDLKIEQVNSMRQWLGGIETGIGQFRKLQTQFIKSQEAFKQGDLKEIFYSQFNVWENLHGLFDLILPDSSSRPNWMAKLNSNVENIKKVTKQSFDIYNQLTSKNFAGAVNSTIELLEKLLYSNNKMFTINKDTLLSILSENNYVPALYDTVIKVGTADISFQQDDFRASVIFERDRHAIQLIRKLAGFLNDVVLTTDAKQLAKVVESYALPPGSYKRKRNSWWSIDLNAFVGAYGGYEIARKPIPSSTKQKSNGFVYGITAPIGLSFSKTFGKRLSKESAVKKEFIRNPDKIRLKKENIYYRSNTTLTFTASIVDLGAVVSYRLKNGSDTVLPQKPTWSQVFSPGFSVALGLKNTPLVLNIGYQYTPKLRRVSSTNAEVLELNSNRISIGLLFDIPILNVLQKSYIPAKKRKLGNSEMDTRTRLKL